MPRTMPARRDRSRLRRAPMVDVAHLMHAADGAVRRAGLRGKELPLHVLGSVFAQRNARKTALLRAVMHEAVFADVEVARTRPAAPVVRQALRNRLLKLIEARVAAPLQ